MSRAIKVANYTLNRKTGKREFFPAFLFFLIIIRFYLLEIDTLLLIKTDDSEQCDLPLITIPFFDSPSMDLFS